MAIIRNLKPEDKDQWIPLWDGYHVFYKSDPSIEIRDIVWEKLTRPDSCPNALGAFSEEGKLLGYCTYIFHESCWTEGPYCYLQDLFVPEKHRGQGIGKTLIESAHKIAKDKGAEQFYWLTQENNTTARKLYDQVANLTDFIKYKI